MTMLLAVYSGISASTNTVWASVHFSKLIQVVLLIFFAKQPFENFGVHIIKEFPLCIMLHKVFFICFGVAAMHAKLDHMSFDS
jgi:hypothetical protein